MPPSKQRYVGSMVSSPLTWSLALHDDLFQVHFRLSDLATPLSMYPLSTNSVCGGEPDDAWKALAAARI